MVEVMIAISVLAFVLLAFLSVIQSSATLSASSREASIAAFQLHAALESTFAVPFEDFKTTYAQKITPDASDPDHPAGTDWTGHLGSLPNGINASKLPDFCQLDKKAGLNFTWKPSGGGSWVKTDDLPLRDQHMKFEWVNWDTTVTETKNIDWVEYRLTLTWTDYRSRPQSDSVMSRRSR